MQQREARQNPLLLIIEDHVDLEVEQLGSPEEDRLPHGSAVGLEHLHGFIHLVQLEILTG
jgi:hypothetical protein